MNKNLRLTSVVLSLGVMALAMSCSPSPDEPARAARKPPRQELVIAGRASVIDGDTLEIHGRRIRLQAIDAPEARQSCRRGDETWPCGRQAAFALADRIGTKPVECRARETDRWGRAVAVCRAGGAELNGWLVEQGWALAYRAYGKDYVGQEEAARAHRRGVWAGSFVPPWEHRRGRKGEVSAESFAGA